ncbi:DUF4279 domain-containing protein [Undibacterium sp. TC9W]|uniref:DUF4279 domain-containing protein n=1 Tax=Undibacterium sp. TC9W TaxID=3413053 RepID=UPI003BF1544A
MMTKKQREFALSLRMTHPEMDLQAFCDLIELIPWKCNLAGEVRQSPDGRLLGGVHKRSFCTCSFEFDEDVSLEAAIDDTLDLLELKRKQIAEMTSSGGELHFFIGWFFEGTAGMVLDWKTLRRMSDLEISFQLDAYGAFLK